MKVIKQHSNCGGCYVCHSQMPSPSLLQCKLAVLSITSIYFCLPALCPCAYQARNDEELCLSPSVDHVQRAQVIHALVEIRLRPVFHTDSQSSSLKSSSVTHRSNSPWVVLAYWQFPFFSHISTLLSVFPGITTHMN